ncbi:MAG: ABC transporter ATP-binding protein, partial [Chloroflexi bacterium]|nr:ABC transporter ATP-binding protein [Chloroflexota bacterium]
QKTALACALIRPYSLLVLDEPVVGLDARAVTALAGMIHDTVAAGSAVLLLTHSETFAARVCTRSIHIDEGKVLDLE